MSERNRFLTTPVDFLKSAIKAVPQVRFALGVGGVAAVVAIVSSFRIAPALAVLGTVVVLAGMVVLLVFARLAAVSGKDMRGPARFLTWAVLLIFVLVLVLLVTSFFFGWPRSLTDAPGRSPAATASQQTPVGTAEPAPGPPPPPPFDQACYERELKKLVGPLPVTGSDRVKCDGGGASGKGEEKATTVKAKAIPGFRLLAPVVSSTTDLNNDGSVGEINYTQDPAGNIIAASVRIHCKSANDHGGSGASAGARLSGEQERIKPIEADEEARLRKSCPAASEAVRTIRPRPRDAAAPPT